MTALTDWPHANAYAQWYVRFAEAIVRRAKESPGASLADDCVYYLAAMLEADFPRAGGQDWRALLEPALELAEGAYQSWARSAAGIAWITEATRTAAALPSPATALAATLETLAETWGLPPDTAARTEVWREGSARLYRYGQTSSAASTPLLIVYAQINRPTILDLEDHCSFIRELVRAGRDVYLLDWGDAGPAEHERSLMELLLGPLHRAALAAGGRRKVDLLGVCQGGVFSLLYAALQPARVRRLVTMVTPVNFQTPEDLLSLWVRASAPALLEGKLSASGPRVSLLFQMLSPYRRGIAKYLDLLDVAGEPEKISHFRRMERWVHGGPDPPERILRTFVEAFYCHNTLLRGTFTLDGVRVDLSSVRAPLLNVYGLRDHIVPADASRALSGLTGSRRYDEWAIPAGHIGMFVSRSARAVPGRIAQWLARR